MSDLILDAAAELDTDVGMGLSPAPTDDALRNGALGIRRSKRLRGTLSFAGDAHLAMLACGLAALGEEPTRIENLPDAPWFHDFRASLESLGVSFEPAEASASGVPHWLVRGGALHAPAQPLEIRHELEALMLAGIVSGLKLDAALRLDPVRISADVPELLKALYPRTNDAGAGPEEGVIRPHELHPKARGFSKPFERQWDEGLAKIVLLFHHLAAHESLELHLRRPGSDLLENLLRHFEIDLKVERDDDKDADELTRRIARQMRAAGKQDPLTRVKLPAGSRPKPAFIALSGDATEASVIALAATLIKGSDVLLENVLLNPGRGGFLTALRRMGADVEVVQRKERFGDAMGAVRVRSSEMLGRRFDAEVLSEMRDEVFLLLVAAAFAEGESVFRQLEHLRSDSIDRLKAFTAALKQAGVETGEIEDGLVIRGKSDYDGGSYDSLRHPGLAAAYFALALKSHGASSLAGAEVLDERHPGLRDRFTQLAAAAAAEKAA